MYINYIKHPFAGLFCLILCACTGKHKDSQASPPTLQNLKQRLSRVDTLIARNQLSRQRLIKKPVKKQLFIYHPKKDTQDIKTTYVIWRDKKKTIKMIGEYPYSISGDWQMAYLHYFDKKGHTFAYRHNTEFFNSSCIADSSSSDIINEDIRIYYDSTFTEVDSSYAMTGAYGRTINPDSCQNPYGERGYQPSRNVTAYLKRIHYDKTKLDSTTTR